MFRQTISVVHSTETLYLDISSICTIMRHVIISFISIQTGLGQDSSNKQLLAGLIEATIKSPLRNALEPTFSQLRAMKLDQVG